MLKKSVILVLLLVFLVGNVNAEIYFEDDFENGYQHMGSDNSHLGGGYFYYMGGVVNGPEAVLPNPCSDRDVHSNHYTVISNDLEAQDSVEGSTYSLKTPYVGYCNDESFLRDVTVINLDENKQEIFIRWYQKFSDPWYDGTVQHKFSKFHPIGDSRDEVSTGYFRFGGTNIFQARINNVDGQFNTPEFTRHSVVSIYPSEIGAGSQYQGGYRYWDNYDNGIGINGEDSEFHFNTKQWYAIEMHVKLNSDEDTSDGILELWVDGVKIFSLTNFRWYGPLEEAIPGIGSFELQHIYYDRTSVDQPTYMDNIVISDEYIGLIIQNNVEPENGICEATGSANCYYVSPNGDDGDEGSFESPWSTFENAVSSLVQPGDYVYARDGIYSEDTDIYAAEGIIIPFTSYSQIEGDASNPITFKSYPGELAVLDGDFNNDVIKFQTTEKTGIIIENFEIINGWYSGIRLEDCPSNIVIRNNHIHDIDGPEGGNIGAIRSNCATIILIENNTLHSSYNLNEPDNNNGAGIFLFSGTNNFLIKNNDISDTKHGIFYKHSGYGQSLFEQNLIHDIWGNGFMIASDNVTMRKNIIVNAARGFDIHEEAGCSLCTRNSIIEYNTVINTEYAYQLNRGGDRPGAIGTIIRNNIFQSSSTPMIWQYGSNEDFLSNKPGLQSYNNLYDIPNLLFHYFGSDSWGDLGDDYSLSEFQNLGFESNSINTNPLFNDVNNNDFRPAQNSPACNFASDGGDVGALLCIGSNEQYCGDNTCNNGETCETCDDDCECIPPSFHDADSNEDGIVSIEELIEYIDLWKTEDKTATQILSAINEYIG